MTSPVTWSTHQAPQGLCLRRVETNYRPSEILASDFADTLEADVRDAIGDFSKQWRSHAEVLYERLVQIPDLDIYEDEDDEPITVAFIVSKRQPLVNVNVRIFAWFVFAFAIGLSFGSGGGAWIAVGAVCLLFGSWRMIVNMRLADKPWYLR